MIALLIKHFVPDEYYSDEEMYLPLDDGVMDDDCLVEYAEESYHR